MSYASYEQEHRDQEVFKKLVEAYKAIEQREKDVKSVDSSSIETKKPADIFVIGAQNNK